MAAVKNIPTKKQEKKPTAKPAPVVGGCDCSTCPGCGTKNNKKK